MKAGDKVGVNLARTDKSLDEPVIRITIDGPNDAHLAVEISLLEFSNMLTGIKNVPAEVVRWRVPSD